MVFYIIGAIGVIIVVYVLVTYNGMIKSNEKVNEAFSTMDVYLKKRWDLIPNLVEVVKCYTKHESDTLENVIKIRNKVYDDLDMNDKLDVNNELTPSITNLMALAESYPKLKANENFKDLSNALTKVEDEIANSRKYYNGTVRIFNNKVEVFPNNIAAKLFGFKTKKMFGINDTERENVKVEL